MGDAHHNCWSRCVRLSRHHFTAEVHLSEDFVEVLRRTLAIIEQHQESWQDALALANLHGDLVRVIGELQARKAARSTKNRQDRN